MTAVCSGRSAVDLSCAVKHLHLAPTWQPWPRNGCLGQPDMPEQCKQQSPCSAVSCWRAGWICRMGCPWLLTALLTGVWHSSSSAGRPDPTGAAPRLRLDKTACTVCGATNPHAASRVATNCSNVVCNQVCSPLGWLQAHCTPRRSAALPGSEPKFLLAVGQPSAMLGATITGGSWCRNK